MVEVSGIIESKDVATMTQTRRSKYLPIFQTAQCLKVDQCFEVSMPNVTTADLVRRLSSYIIQHPSAPTPPRGTRYSVKRNANDTKAVIALVKEG